MWNRKTIRRCPTTDKTARGPSGSMTNPLFAQDGVSQRTRYTGKNGKNWNHYKKKQGKCQINYLCGGISGKSYIYTPGERTPGRFSEGWKVVRVSCLTEVVPKCDPPPKCENPRSVRGPYQSEFGQWQLPRGKIFAKKKVFGIRTGRTEKKIWEAKVWIAIS